MGYMLVNQINNELKKVFKALGYDQDQAVVSISKRQDLCEYQCNSIFKLAKENKKSPVEIGNIIVDAINKDANEIFKKVEFVAPGFINIDVSDTYKAKMLDELINSDKLVTAFDKKTYMLDYGGPNVAKPLHVGHLRSAVLGESLKRLYNYLGHKTISDVHLGDYGLQIGQVIFGLISEGLDDLSTETLFDINDLERIYPQVSSLCKSDDVALNQARLITSQLQDGHEKYNALFKEIVRISIEDIKKNYQKMDVSFDLWYGESDSFEFMDATLDKMNENNLITIDDGAKIVKFADDKFPVLLVGKSDGSFLYATSDLATIYQREMDYNPDEYVYVVDGRQALHFNQVFEVAKLANIVSSETKLTHVKFGTMNGSDNKPFKTRDGGTIKLQQLFEMVEEKLIQKAGDNHVLSSDDIQILVNSVIKFADLQNFRETNYIFELDRFTEFTGKTGPYILYSAVRIRKIIMDAKVDEISFVKTVNNQHLDNIEFKILNFDHAVNACLNDYSMHHLCEYIFDLSSEVNSLYQSLHILSLKDQEKVYVISTLKLAYKVIEDALNILGIGIPSKM